MLDFGQTVKVFAINFAAEVTKLTVFPTSTSNIEAKSSVILLHITNFMSPIAVIYLWAPFHPILQQTINKIYVHTK